MKTAWWVALVAACGPSVTPDRDDSSSGFASSSGDAPDEWPPPQCPPAMSPFLEGECLDALANGCDAYVDETACAAAPVATFDGYTVVCRWATVTTIADRETCEVASVGGRCVAALDGHECLLPCTADPTTNEIIEVCDGPLDASSAVGAEPG